MDLHGSYKTHERLIGSREDDLRCMCGVFGEVNLIILIGNLKQKEAMLMMHTPCCINILGFIKGWRANMTFFYFQSL